MKSNDHFTKFGTFNISPDKQVIGELCVSDSDSYLLLADKESFISEDISDICITGTLHDNTKVTLIQCVSIEFRSTMRAGDYHSWRLFPHFVICGDSHLSIDDRTIKDIRLFVEDASTLMFDFDAFSIARDARPHIDEIVRSQGLERKIAIGKNPVIAYFTGNDEIFRVNTVLGEISSRHNLSMNTGGPDGVSIDNAISVSITPKEPINFRESTDRTLVLLRFFELVIGRSQSLNEFRIRIGDNDEAIETLQVYWGFKPKIFEQDQSNPHPIDVLTDPIRRNSEFCTVLIRWLEMDMERKDARNRFSSCFALGNKYTIDRLVGAANMFDILPDSAVPKVSELTPELIEAKQHCQQKFKALPDSLERQSTLNALGRIGKSSLKHKVRFRAKYIIDDADNDRLPELNLILDAAVDCRNHYVHGSNSKISYSSNSEFLAFFTNTLEFVFTASELIESGWDIKAWCKKGTTMTHPFGAYLVNYAGHLEKFKQARFNQNV